MNEFKTFVIPFASRTGGASLQLNVDFKLATGTAARIHSVEFYSNTPLTTDARGGGAWYPYAGAHVPRVLADENAILRDPAPLWRLRYSNENQTSGYESIYWPLIHNLWELDYRLIMPSTILFFPTQTVFAGWAIRYKVVRATKGEVAAILFYQNEGLKIA